MRSITIFVGEYDYNALIPPTASPVVPEFHMPHAMDVARGQWGVLQRAVRGHPPTGISYMRYGPQQLYSRPAGGHIGPSELKWPKSLMEIKDAARMIIREGEWK